MHANRFIIIVCALIFLFDAADAQTSAGEVVIGNRVEIKSQFSDYTYNVSVYLPIKYGTEKEIPDQQYPVLYLFIGWDHMFHAASGIVGLLEDFEEIPDMIVVGITNINWWKDLTPEQIAGRNDSGGAEVFLDFINQQLMPYVESTYRTSEHRLFMGHSLGGMFGIYALTEQAGLFEDYVLLSPSIEGRANTLYPKLSNIMTSSKNLENNIYMIVGSEGERMDRGMAKLSDAFSQCESDDFRWEMERRDDLNHFTIVLPGMMNGLKFVAKDDVE